MNKEQLKLLTTMKKLIKEGKRKFKVRKDRDYLQDLLELGITEELAWYYILQLNNNFYFCDPKPSYYKNNNCLIFKRQINGINTYIKLTIDNNKKEEKTVCLSFHKDTRSV